MKFSIIIPLYNEEKSARTTLTKLQAWLRQNQVQAEIIAIDDGSKDQTRKILEQIQGIRLIKHPYNKGYGASLKTGAANSLSDWLLFYDGDGQHQPEHIAQLTKDCQDYDMIVGARTGYQGPALRQPGKKLLNWTANYLVKYKIPDLNSGLRLVRKSKFLKYAHIYPNGFSLTTTITLAFLRDRLNVKYIPIQINHRQGRSSVRPKDAFETFLTILRTITLFSPLRIFLPVSFLLFLLSLVYPIFEWFKYQSINISDSTVLFFISSLLIFFFGLLADQISAIRREKQF